VSNQICAHALQSIAMAVHAGLYYMTRCDVISTCPTLDLVIHAELPINQDALLRSSGAPMRAGRKEAHPR
jgi:hypothetical protein